ncbi:glycosyltransferase [uncultured Flavobacterium sp.]|uniref:glycosyltransferase n=1 Tax=uncultured Flavobacterium sp. TaxID=165435 RepID=UPI0030C802AD
MISIVICSRNETLFNKLKESIKNTIGRIEHEIIRIDNLMLNESITKIYNKGIAMAKYECLLFVHEDVVFHTYNWGSILTSIFNQNPNVGLIGIAGTKYKSKYPSAFWHTDQKMLHFNLIQHYNKKSPKHFKIGFKNSNLVKVVAIDGVFLALRKSTNVTFNEEIKGFHCYDLGISIDILENNYDVVVTDQLLIEHFSIGNTNLDFVKGVIMFHELYKNKLPKFINSKKTSLETVALKRFLEICLENRYIPYKLWFFYLSRKPFTRLNYNLLKLLIYKIRT